MGVASTHPVGPLIRRRNRGAPALDVEADVDHITILDDIVPTF